MPTIQPIERQIGKSCAVTQDLSAVKFCTADDAGIDVQGFMRIVIPGATVEIR